MEIVRTVLYLVTVNERIAIDKPGWLQYKKPDPVEDFKFNLGQRGVLGLLPDVEICNGAYSMHAL